MSRFPALALLLAALCIPLAARSEQPTYNRVSLDESAQAEVDNDQLVAVLFAQAEGRDAATPADEVNRLIDWAVNVAKSHPTVKVQTLGYRTNAVYNKGNIRGWRVNQSLRLESRDGRLMGDLVAQLQERLGVQSIAYEVSDEQRRQHLDALTGEALKRFQARAAAIARSLGRDGYRLVRINISDGQRGPAPMVRSMRMEAASDMAVAPAQFEAGTQQLTVSVNGEIELNGN